MESVDRIDEVMPAKPATKGNCKQPCAEISEAYQKADVKTDIKRAFQSRSSYSHGTRPLSANCRRAGVSDMPVRETDKIPPGNPRPQGKVVNNAISCDMQQYARPCIKNERAK